MAGGAQASVPLYTTEGGWLHLEPSVLVEDALRAKEDGFGGVKIKIGRPHVSEDMARLRGVRDACGPAFEIMTDANQLFTADEAIRRARHYEALDIAWFEEPLPADDLGGHARLARSTSLPIAVGESLYSALHFREYLQAGACSIVQVDVARIGGVTPWLKVAHLAETFNVPVCPHFLMELHVALCCAVPNARWVEYIPQLDSLVTGGLRIEKGRALPSHAPGIGIDWDWEAICRLAVGGELRGRRRVTAAISASVARSAALFASNEVSALQGARDVYFENLSARISSLKIRVVRQTDPRLLPFPSRLPRLFR